MENSFLLSLKRSINAINDGLTYCYWLTKAKFLWLVVSYLLLNLLRILPLFFRCFDFFLLCHAVFIFCGYIYIKIGCVHSILFTQLNDSKQMICCPDAIWCCSNPIFVGLGLNRTDTKCPQLTPRACHRCLVGWPTLNGNIASSSLPVMNRACAECKSCATIST